MYVIHSVVVSPHVNYSTSVVVPSQVNYCTSVAVLQVNYVAFTGSVEGGRSHSHDMTRHDRSHSHAAISYTRIKGERTSTYHCAADESVSQQSSEFKRVQPFWANNPPASYNTSGGQSEQSNSPLSLPQQDFFSTNPNN